MTLNLDKSTWKRVALGDVVQNLNVTVKNPSAEGIDRVIAMEHLDPGELEINRWGNLEGGTTFTRRVRPGQTLFGKRRAYQRKSAYAEFDAICSGDILVFEADHRKMCPDFLPFLVQSEGFYGHALGTSAGSLSPRTNWRDLANYEFDLPPLDEQKRIAQLLWAVEQSGRMLNTRRRSLDAVRHSFLEKEFTGTDVESVPLEQLIRKGTTITYGMVQAGPEFEGGIPYIRVSDMTDGQLSIQGMKRASPAIAAKFERSRVSPGDFVVALRGRTGLTLRVPAELQGANLTQGTARVAIDAGRISPDYVLAVMNSSWMQRQVQRVAKGSTFTELSLAALRGLRIPMMASVDQDLFLKTLAQIEEASSTAREEINAIGLLKNRLMAELFEVQS